MCTELAINDKAFTENIVDGIIVIAENSISETGASLGYPIDWEAITK